MPACPRDKQYATTSALTNANTSEKCEQVLDLLRKIMEKCQEEPLFLEQQPKQTNLLVSIAQLTLLSSSNSTTDDRRAHLNNIMNIGQDLLTDSTTTNTNPSVDICKTHSPLYHIEMNYFQVLHRLRIQLQAQSLLRPM